MEGTIFVPKPIVCDACGALFKHAPGTQMYDAPIRHPTWSRAMWGCYCTGCYDRHKVYSELGVGKGQRYVYNEGSDGTPGTGEFRLTDGGF